MKKHLATLCSAVFALVTVSVLVSGCLSKTKDYPVTVCRFLIEARANEGGIPVRLPESGLTMNARNSPEFTEYDIVKTTLIKSQMGPFLSFQLTPIATRDLYRFSVSNLGLRLILTINGEVVGARLIDGPLADGNILIYAEINDDELPELVKNINKNSDDIQKEIAKKK